MPFETLEIQLDLTVYGTSDVIETRVSRSVFGHLSIGDDVTVVDDSVEDALGEGPDG